MPRYTITNFSRGEFGPQLYGRVDVPQYNAGAKEITNFIIQRYGGVGFRPGFRFVGEVDDKTKKYRYIPFQFSIDQAYVMVLGDAQLRLLASGGIVTETDLKVQGATKAAQCVLQIAFHDMVIGDRIYLDGITGMIELNGRFAKVVGVPDASHVTIDVNSTGFTTYTGSTGIIRSGAPTPPPTPPAPPPAPPAAPPPPTTTSPTPSTTPSSPGTYYVPVGNRADPLTNIP